MTTYEIFGCHRQSRYALLVKKYSWEMLQATIDNAREALRTMGTNYPDSGVYYAREILVCSLELQRRREDKRIRNMPGIVIV